jgi:hypothetical protein
MSSSVRMGVEFTFLRIPIQVQNCIVQRRKQDYTGPGSTYLHSFDSVAACFFRSEVEKSAENETFSAFKCYLISGIAVMRQASALRRL